MCIGLVVAALVSACASSSGAPPGYRFTAFFKATRQLQPNTDVRLAGVNVGTVVSVTARDTESVVTIALSAQFAPIPADTEVIFYKQTSVDDDYVDLVTGSRKGPKLPNGGVIPTSHTAVGHQSDQIMNVFSPPSRTVPHRIRTPQASGPHA